jgi:hypothetical protein
VSPAISTVIITGTIVVLVMVAYTYVFQALDRQGGISEFEIAKKGILAFDDAVENIAWKPWSSRSTRFVANYGAVELVPNALNLTVTASNGTHSFPYPSILTGVVKYFMRTDYITYGNNFKEYILGSENTVTSGSVGKLGQAVVEQQSRLVNITLSYRVSAMKTSEVYVGAQYITYIDIQIIRINIANRSSFTGEFDLGARCTDVSANSTQFPVSSGTTGLVSARFGVGQIYSWTTPPLRGGTVVFNLLVANVEVSA